MSRQVARLLNKCLKNLVTNHTLETSMGICANAHESLSRLPLEQRPLIRGIYPSTLIQDKLMELFPRWPEYSGNLMYPIRSYGSDSPSGKYDRTRNLWNENTLYGQARHRLYHFLLAELKKEI